MFLSLPSQFAKSRYEDLRRNLLCKREQPSISCDPLLTDDSLQARLKHLVKSLRSNPLKFNFLQERIQALDVSRENFRDLLPFLRSISSVKKIENREHQVTTAFFMFLLILEIGRFSRRLEDHSQKYLDYLSIQASCSGLIGEDVIEKVVVNERYQRFFTKLHSRVEDSSEPSQSISNFDSAFTSTPIDLFSENLADSKAKNIATNSITSKKAILECIRPNILLVPSLPSSLNLTTASSIQSKNAKSKKLNVPPTQFYAKLTLKRHVNGKFNDVIPETPNVK